MVFEITPLYALPVAVIYLILWIRVSAARAGKNVSIGDGGDPALLRRIRQHGNCAEWSVFVLILMMLAEGTGVPASGLHTVGAFLLIGRIAHPFGLSISNIRSSAALCRQWLEFSGGADSNGRPRFQNGWSLITSNPKGQSHAVHASDL